MSDDTSERMDRAERIRQMREGQRSADGDDPAGETDGDDAAADRERESPEQATDGSAGDESAGDGSAGDGSAGDESAGGESADGESGDDGSVDGESGDDAPATDGDSADGGEASPDPSAGSTDEGGASEEVTDEATADESNANADEPNADEATDGNDGAGGPDDSGVKQQPDEDAIAAAQRAAQSAAQVTGGESAETPVEADAADGGASAAATQGPTGVELPDEETVQSAIADEVLESDDAGGTARAGVVDGRSSATQEETVRVLEFTLGAEHYCLDIEHVEEIVKRESITRVPNTPEYVEGVVDLRGQITTILDPKTLFDIDADGPESLLVVFDPDEFEDQGAIGWVVDAVRQVVPVPESAVNAPPVDDDYVEGVVDRDDEDEFVIWTDPEVAIRLAAEGDDED